MGADGLWEGSSDRILWPAGNDQLEFLQVVDLDPSPESAQETVVVFSPRGIIPETTTLVQCVYHNNREFLMWNAIECR